MMDVDVKIDTALFDRAFAQFAANSRRTTQAVLRGQARLFVRDAAKNTPPNRNNRWRRAAGRRAVTSDVNHILVGLQPKLYAQFIDIFGGRTTARELRRKDGTVYVADTDHAVSDIKGWHNSQRTAGRVRMAGKKTRDIGRSKSWRRGVVPIAKKRAYLKQVLDRVGMLVGGWNAAAVKFGYRMPDWIQRHGTRRGSGVEVVGARGVLVRIINSVKYATAIKGMRRRVQYALNNRALQMNKQLEEMALKKAAKQAGFATAA